MRKYHIALEETHGKWSTPLGVMLDEHSKIFNEVGIEAPATYAGWDAGTHSLKWDIRCTENQLLILMLKHNAILL